MPLDPSVALERFVPRMASEWDIDAPNARWRELDGTLCFVDISGFTALSERLAMRGRIGVEELTDVLDRVFGTMLEIAFERGGTLLKFGGDALLLLFDGPDHPRQGASAAVEMRAALRAATKQPMSVGRVQLRMSVGLHSGPVQLFRVGSVHHELLVTGPAATRTTQMEHAASAGQIFVSTDMAARLPPGATRPGPGETCELRWRQAAAAPTGATSRRAAPTATVRDCVPVVLREHLMAGEVEFEHRIAAVAFIRFQGVDALLAAEGPAAVAEALDRTVSTIQVAADAEGVAFLASDLDEDGGKVILVSGVPRAQADDEGRMLRALRLIADAELALPLQIGVNQGHVVAGTIGSAYRATFTVMGDTVNLAARLMAAAPRGEVYATAGILDRSRPIFAVTQIPPFHVKGKSQPVQAYAIGEEVGTRTADPGQGPFVGRRTELDTVNRVLRPDPSAQGGVPIGALTIVGDPGMGKSRLVNEALAESEVDALVVRGEPDGTTSPYRSFRDAMRGLLGIERADQATMVARLSAAVERIDATLLPLLPLIGTVAHINTPPTREVQAIEPQYLPDQLASAIGRLLHHALGPRAAIVVEDAQWTDAASEALLTRLAPGAGRPMRWPMIVVRRDAAGGFATAGSPLRLGPLDDDDVRQLLTAVAELPLRPHEVERIVSRTAGSPLVLHALVRLGRERGVDDLPDSLEAVIAAEVDVLAPLPRLLLNHAAVLGRSFNPLVWQQLVAEDGFDIDATSSAQLERFLEFDATGAAHFRQVVVRDVAYGGLPFRRRQVLHLRAGLLTERLAAGAVDSVADLLSLHFFEGGDHERAWRYARIAGAKAQATFANVEAAALYRRALEAGRRLDGIAAAEHGETWTSLGDVLEQAGLLEDALDSYRRAIALTDGDLVTRARLVLKRAQVRERSGAFATALRDIRAAERALDGHTDDAAVDQVRVVAAALRAFVRRSQEQPRRALVAAQLAADEAKRIGELRQLARAYSVIDWAHVEMGDLDRAVHEPDIVAIFETLGEPHRAAAALGNQGAILYWLGRWSEALDCYERSIDAWVQTGSVIDAAIQQANVAELLINRRDLAAARPLVLEASQTHRAVGYIGGALFDEIQLGRILQAEGDHVGAAEQFEAVRDEAVARGMRGTALEAAIHLADCRLDAGESDEALAILTAAEQAAESDAALLAGSAALVRARALFQQGQDDAARAEVAAGVAAARRMQLRYELGLLLLLDPDPESREEGHALLTALDVDAELLSG